MKVIFAKVSSGRKPEYRVQTILLDKNGKRFAQKQAFSHQSQAHINQIGKLYGKLVENIQADTVCYAKVTEQADMSVTMEYIQGESLEQLIYKSFLEDDKESFLSQIEAYFTLLNSAFKTTTFVPTQEFCEFFKVNASMLIGEKSMVLSNIDMNWDNLIIDPSNRHISIIDFEWLFEFPIPIKFIAFRAIYYFYVHRPEVDKFISSQSVLEQFDLIQYKDLFTEMEKNYQQRICGQNYLQNYLKPRLNFRSFEQIRQENQTLSAQVEQTTRTKAYKLSKILGKAYRAVRFKR